MGRTFSGAGERARRSSQGGSRMADLQTVGSALLTLGLVAVAVVLSLYERLIWRRTSASPWSAPSCSSPR